MDLKQARKDKLIPKDDMCEFEMKVALPVGAIPNMNDLGKDEMMNLLINDICESLKESTKGLGRYQLGNLEHEWKWTISLSRKRVEKE